MIHLHLLSTIPSDIFSKSRQFFKECQIFCNSKKREVHLACTGPPCRGWLPTGAVSWGRQVHLDTANLPTVCARAEQAQRASNPQTGPTLKQPTPVSYPAFPTHLANFLQLLFGRPMGKVHFLYCNIFGGSRQKNSCWPLPSQAFYSNGSECDKSAKHPFSDDNYKSILCEKLPEPKRIMFYYQSLSGNGCCSQHQLEEEPV